MFKEVTKDEFFKQIGPLDVHPQIVGDYPYTSLFKMQHNEGGFLFGQVIGRIENQGFGRESKYFLISQLGGKS